MGFQGSGGCQFAEDRLMQSCKACTLQRELLGKLKAQANSEYKEASSPVGAAFVSPTPSNLFNHKQGQ
jgi:hypothetical protein